ncbi:MAG TPA: ATP-binding cassette domain-containing protein [Casimicrobiaceae bacterium]|nr:ATP-binding cassette domain-containing protein [Casimicrobiaceae bacterium]
MGEWTVEAGARVAVCGPSGSGKTSLLSTLAGIDRFPTGRVRWGDVDVQKLSSAAADRWRHTNIGFVFQHFYLFPGLSALENVIVTTHFDRFQADKMIVERARALLDRVGVADQRRIESLSRGEMQRVAVARAVVHRPAIVLADEPTASLDRDNANRIGTLLNELCRQFGTTLIVATHDSVLAQSMDARFDLAQGELVAGDQPA